MPDGTPTKRRRRNDFQPPPQPVRSLDFFFGKQKGAQVVAQKPKDDATISSQEPVDGDKTTPPPLTDEELARQLQEEWNRQDDNQAETATSSPLENQTQQVDGSNVRKNEKLPIPTQPKVEKATLSLQSVSSTEDDITTRVPFDEPPLSFDPQKYIADLEKSWTRTGNEASYGLLCHAFVLINSTPKRIKIVNTLTNFLRTIIEGDPKSLLSAVCRWRLNTFCVSMLISS